MKHCVIGKNSRIVSQLTFKGSVDSYSCCEIMDIDWDKYDLVWLFSWFYTDLEKNIAHIKAIPASKLVFISSQSVSSVQIAPQPFRYVNDKLKCENITLTLGGRVCRLASVDFKTVEGNGELVAFTSLEKLQDFISHSKPETLGSITELYDIVDGNKHIKNFRIERWIDKLRIFKPINLLHAFASRAFGLKSYGYSRDCQRVLANTAVVGHGAIAGYATQDFVTRKDLTFVSNRNDRILKSKGFRHQVIGLSKFGLGSRWHGVTTYIGNKDFVVKKVDRIVFRSSRNIPVNLFKKHVTGISYTNNKFIIIAKNNNGSEAKFYCNKLILGAGWQENIRLLSSLLNGRLETKLTDDESAVIGTISIKEAIEFGLVEKNGPLISFKNGLVVEKGKAFVEARLPMRSSKEYLNYYTSQFRIVLGLIKSLNVRKLNSAIFNKFGMGLALGNELDIFLTAVAKDSITYKADKGAEVECYRKRSIENSIEHFQAICREKFSSFKQKQNITTLDGLHVTGGADILKITTIKKLIDEGILVILGAPGPAKNDPFHTTTKLQKKARQEVEKFYRSEEQRV